uniref:Helicase n=1 Tax=Mimivirus LCMiAC01 TaxID=2506608 RepID=A0A481Z240_9VIRU|nr:MAG: helicase [Mimivirus LCMiAC01]
MPDILTIDNKVFTDKSDKSDKSIDIYRNIEQVDSNKTSFNKFSQCQWNKIEKKYNDPLMYAVLDMMDRLGSNDNAAIKQKTKLKVCGNNIYIEIMRPELESLGYVDRILRRGGGKKRKDGRGKKKKRKRGNKKKKKGISKAEIIMQNTKRLMVEEMNTAVDGYRKYGITMCYGFSSQYAEIRLCTLIHCINYVLKHKSSLSSCYELIMGTVKTLHNVKEMDGISSLACFDLSYCLDNLKSHCKFRNEYMFEHYPKLCLSTIYDKVFPSMSIKPYLSQIQLMETVKKNNRFLCRYNVMIGSGKTTISMALAKYVNEIRVLQKAGGTESKLQLIFSCSIDPVRQQVCMMAYNAGIPFGISVIEDDIVKVINNYNCRNDKERLLIVADLNSTIGLLKKSKDYILFLDEPTVGADEENHPITKAITNIIFIAPNKTILSSATLPNLEEMNNMLKYCPGTYSNIMIIDIYSGDALIGCEMIKKNGTTITPHNNCKSKDALMHIIHQLKTKAFIGRLYTAPIVYRLRQRMIECGVENVINLESHFSDISMISQSKIQVLAVKLLEMLFDYDDTIIEQICKEDDTTNKLEQYDFNKMFTTQAHRYIGHCLVTVSNPLEFAAQYSKELLVDCPTAEKLIKKYNSDMSLYDNGLKRLDVDIKNKIERSQMQQEMEEIKRPHIQFPEELRINSIHHIKKYAPDFYNDNNDNNIDKQLIPNLKVLEDYPLGLNVPDWVMLLLFAGVGIYDPNNRIFNKTYTETVLNMASDGQLSFMISTDDICYGANYPFSHVVITDDIAKKHSINTIFQLAGRAGRVGRSWVAYVHVGDETAAKITQYIHDTTDNISTVEGINMMSMFKNIYSELTTKAIEYKENKKPESPKKKMVNKKNQKKPSELLKNTKSSYWKRPIRELQPIRQPPRGIKYNNRQPQRYGGYRKPFSYQHHNQHQQFRRTQTLKPVSDTAYVPPHERSATASGLNSTSENKSETIHDTNKTSKTSSWARRGTKRN